VPLNESFGRKRSNLTKEQKQQALAAIYGISEEVMQPITHEEAARLREILLEHDKQNTAPTKEFDLNNPPQKPYRYQAWPKLVYHHEYREYDKAKNQMELDALLSEGFQLEPFPSEEDIPLDAASAAEAAKIQKQLDELNKGKQKRKYTRRPQVA
jgi:hypothetical protein